MKIPASRLPKVFDGRTLVVLTAIRTGADAAMGRLARRTGAGEYEEEYEDEYEDEVSGARSRRRVVVDADADRATWLSSVEELMVGMIARVGTALAVMTMGSMSSGTPVSCGTSIGTAISAVVMTAAADIPSRSRFCALDSRAAFSEGIVNAPFGSMTNLFQIPRRLGRTGRSLQAIHAEEFAQNRQTARTMLGVKHSRFHS